MKNTNQCSAFGIIRRLAFLISIVFFCKVSSASPVTEFGEQSTMLVGTCLSLEYLKKRHCPAVSAIEYKSCIKQAEDLLPQRLRAEFRQAMAMSDRDLHSTISDAIDRGYAKSVSLLNGDRQSACANYATSINTVIYLKHEELKRVAQRIR